MRILLIALISDNHENIVNSSLFSTFDEYMNKRMTLTWSMILCSFWCLSYSALTLWTSVPYSDSLSCFWKHDVKIN